MSRLLIGVVDLGLFVLLGRLDVQKVEPAELPAQGEEEAFRESRRRRTRVGAPYDHYSMLRTAEELLGLSPLGNAATAPSMVSAFNLGATVPVGGDNVE